MKPALLCGLTELLCHNKALGSFGVAVGDLNLVTVVQRFCTCSPRVHEVFLSWGLSSLKVIECAYWHQSTHFRGTKPFSCVLQCRDLFLPAGVRGWGGTSFHDNHGRALVLGTWTQQGHGFKSLIHVYTLRKTLCLWTCKRAHVVGSGLYRINSVYV